MATAFEIGLSNAVMAAGLPVLVYCVTRVWRHPSVVHALWLLVLLKSVTPPIVQIPVPTVVARRAVRAVAPVQQSEHASVASLTLLDQSSGCAGVREGPFFRGFRPHFCR